VVEPANVDAGHEANKREWLQVLLAVLLFLLHVVLLGFILLGAFVIGAAIGALEILVSRKMSRTATLGGLKPWVLGFGIGTVILSVGYIGLAYVLYYT
jgi:uncharacterized membrane protein